MAECVHVEEKWSDIHTILERKSKLINSFWNIVDHFLAMSVTNTAIARSFISDFYHNCERKTKIIVFVHLLSKQFQF